jgi:G2/mitotic-specific cyclin-B, other
MSSQHDINEKMRSILIDWLIEVHLKFKLMPETMFLTVNIIDRFLEKKAVVRQKLQLVGVTAMLLAAKYEEIYAPEVRDFVYITDKAYTREQILAMEAAMLNALEFRVTVPTSYVFLQRFLKVANYNDHPRFNNLAMFLLERTLQEYRMIQFPPSKIAASCVNIALRTLIGNELWDATMVHYTGYQEVQLRDCIQEIQNVLSLGKTSSLQAVTKKFSLPRFNEVSGVDIVQI